MRVVELSNHPRTMLQEARKRRTADARREGLQFERAVTQHRERVARARRARDQGRDQHRWWAWWRGVLAVWRERRQAPVAPDQTRPSLDEEEILAAGLKGERLVAAGLGRDLGDDWTLLRGYRNRRGEIDHLLLGPRGLFAIESKHRNATVHCAGDRWWFTKYDNYGNVVGRGEMTDQRGRSPSEQLNQPARLLEEFLRSRGHPVDIQRIVLLTHPRSRLGKCDHPTVHIVTSTAEVVSLLHRSSAVIGAGEREQLERLIVRDHRYYETRHPPRPAGPG
jgi:hypothetical protein